MDTRLRLLHTHPGFRWCWAGQSISSAGSQVMYGSIPLGSGLAGALGESLGTRAAAAIGALLLACSLLPVLTRHIHTLTTLKQPNT